ncbi:MAG: hypothetical protein FWG67_02350 [Defluviitaleaceae bacterium]|nr:hypothetical protein [Defluviitaleaceae bacterium]
MKRFRKRRIVLALLALTTLGPATLVAQAGNNDSTSATNCTRQTAPGNNRSGTCSLTQTQGRRGTVAWSHQQFTLSTEGRNVSRGTASSVQLSIGVNNGVTSANWSFLGNGSTGTVTRGRVVGIRPMSGGMLD